jgi:hypothetical protein
MDQQKKLDEILYAKLSMETAQMAWKELERFFASGALIIVSNDLDLVEVAVRFANDEKPTVAKWLGEGQLARVSDAHALKWFQTDASLWTVVVKPWILVQEEKRTAH